MTTSENVRILRSTANAQGLTDGDLRRLTAGRELVRLRRGAYLNAEVATHLDAVSRHRHHVHAAVAAQAIPGVVSHQSAAVVHGLDLWSTPLGAVHLTKVRRNAGRRTPSLHVHSAPIDDSDVVIVDGLAVTSIARTVVDLARTLLFEPAVVVADSALFRKTTSHEQLAALLERAPGVHGNARAALVVDFADPGGQSVGESRSRVGMRRAGLLMPGLQRDIFSEKGRFVARVDFDWGALLGEFDGLQKYDLLLRPGETMRDAIAREKQREAELRDLGYDIIRWIWADLDHPELLYARIRRALDRILRRTS